MFLTNEQTLTPSFSVDMTVASKSKQNGTLQNILKPFKVVCYLQFLKITKFVRIVLSYFY